MQTKMKPTNQRRQRYWAWKAMKDRCGNPRNLSYKNYGKRGITVCDRWLEFENFYADMGDCPKGHTLERIDNGGNYEPSNCRWATYIEQGRNRRVRSDNKSRVSGVTRESNRWKVTITVDRVRLYLGLFKELDEAIGVRKQAELRYWKGL